MPTGECMRSIKETTAVEGRVRGVALILALIAVAIAILIGLAVAGMRDASTTMSDHVVRLAQSRLSGRSALEVANFVVENHSASVDGDGQQPQRMIFEAKPLGAAMSSVTVVDAVTGQCPTRSTVAVRYEASVGEVNPPEASDPVVVTVSAIERVQWPDVVARVDIDLSEFALLATTAQQSPGVAPKISIGTGAEVAVWRESPLAALAEPLVIGSVRRDPADVTIATGAHLRGVQTLRAGAFARSTEEVERQIADGARTLPEDIHVPRLQVATGPGEDFASPRPMRDPYSLLNNPFKPNMSLELPGTGRFTSFPLTFAGALQPGQWRIVRICGLEVTVERCHWKFEVPTMLVIEGKLELLDGTRFEVGERGALTIVALDGVLVDNSYIGPALDESGTWSTTGAQPYGGIGASRVMILEGGNPLGFRLTYVATDSQYRPTGARRDLPGGTSPTITKDFTGIINGGAVVGEIYAPDSTVKVGSNSALYGRALAHQIEVLPGARVFYDPQLDSGAGWLNQQSGIWGGSAIARPEVRSIALLNDAFLARFSNETELAVDPVGSGMLMTADSGEGGFFKRDMNAVAFQHGSGNGGSPHGLGPTQGAPTPVGVPGADYIFPSNLVLQGTIRDFRGRLDLNGHPDFALQGSAPRATWVIGERLDDDGNPVASRPPATGASSQRAIDSAASFATWFRDTPCQNISRPRSLSLSRVASYGHTPEDPRWVYGVNGGSLGMDSNRCYMDNFSILPGWRYGVNLTWTVEFEYDFVYRRDKAQWLHVSATNDVWVYLDGKLLMDIGGRSQPTFRAIHLNDVATSFGLIDQQASTVKIFIANRYESVQPDFQLWMNFPFHESPMPEIVAFSRLEDIKRAQGDVAAKLRTGIYAPLAGVAADRPPRILGYTTAAATATVPSN
jgi:fibro-slime domain-containing protein